MEDKSKRIEDFRNLIEEAYEKTPTGCGGSFEELLCFELHEQPVNPRMGGLNFNKGKCTGLTFTELASKWGISTEFLGEVIADHCKKLDGGY